MKISELYNLKKTQYELDFVDIDPDKDIPLFLDPYYISKCDFPFASDAQDTIRSYFEYLLALLRGKQIRQAEEVFHIWGKVTIFVWECLAESHVVMEWDQKIQ